MTISIVPLLPKWLRARLRKSGPTPQAAQIQPKSLNQANTPALDPVPKQSIDDSPPGYKVRWH